MKEITKPALILLIITAVAAALLGIVESITAEPIRISKENAQIAAMQTALPEAASFEEVKADFGEKATISAVSKGLDNSGAVVGYVITANPNGFGGAVPTTVGFNNDGVITGIQVTTPSETPGLGANASGEGFLSQFAGKSGKLAVSKDGGEINAMTSATITSRAVVSGVEEARVWFEANGGAK